MPVLRDWLTAEQLAAMEELVPERLTMGNGRRSRLTYSKDGPPVLSARIQELYGIEGRFSLGRGRVPVKIEVLAPNQRPIQVTEDLTSFWRTIYPKIRPSCPGLPPPRVALEAPHGTSTARVSTRLRDDGRRRSCTRPARRPSPLRLVEVLEGLARSDDRHVVVVWSVCEAHPGEGLELAHGPIDPGGTGGLT